MANGKKRVKSHRSPDWRPKVDYKETLAAKRMEKISHFPVWGSAFFAANLGLVIVGGVVSILAAAGACLLHWTVLKSKTIPTANKLLYCLLILVGSWAVWFVLMIAYQAVFGA